MVPGAEVRSYYDHPVLKPPVWKWPVPAYLFTGGLSGGSALLAAGASMCGDPALARRARITALVSIGVSGILLVKDLGRPARFYNMLRVVKVTSPMSVGSWLIAAYAPLTAAAALSDVLHTFPKAGDAAGLGAGVLGSAVATYTGVLIADTAVPVWHEARHQLPFLFAAGAAASSGAVATMLTPVARAGPARRLAAGGALAEVAAAQIMERHLGDLAAPYHLGTAGRLNRRALALSIAGAAVTALFGRRRLPAVVGGALIAGGAALTRFAVFEAGKASASDPKYVVGPQRRLVDESRPPGLT